MKNQSKHQNPEALGVERFTYTRDQLRQLIDAWLANNWGVRATLECSELIWPRRHYTFAATMIDKIREHSKRVATPEGTFITPEMMADSILDSIWKEFENEAVTVTLTKHERLS